ncbi:hypothetical protein D9M71_679800 [compost metagenome]
MAAELDEGGVVQRLQALRHVSQGAGVEVFGEGVQGDARGHQLQRLASDAAGLQGIDGVAAEKQAVTRAQQAKATAQAAVGEGGVGKDVQGGHQRVSTWS